MKEYYFEDDHISDSGMMKYIALSDLSGENGKFARLVQKHLCCCRGCREKLRLFENLSESSRAIRMYSIKSGFAARLSLLNESGALSVLSDLVAGEEETLPLKKFH